MKFDFSHPAAETANKSDKKKHPWEVVLQHWKVQQMLNGRYIQSFAGFLEYAARCYVPLSYAMVTSRAERGRIMLAVAVPVTYKQLGSVLGVSQPTASKLISDMKEIGCKYENHLLLMPAVNSDLFEVLDEEFGSKNRAAGRAIERIFGGGKKPPKSKDGNLEPFVIPKRAGVSEEADGASEGDDEDGEEQEQQVSGDRIARGREVGEVGTQLFF